MLKMPQIRSMAKRLGVNSFGLKKPELIRRIQTAEGNFPCFGTAKDYCDRHDCLWRDDCLPKRT